VDNRLSDKKCKKVKIMLAILSKMDFNRRCRSFNKNLGVLL